MSEPSRSSVTRIVAVSPAALVTVIVTFFAESPGALTDLITIFPSEISAVTYSDAEEVADVPTRPRVAASFAVASFVAAVNATYLIMFVVIAPVELTVTLIVAYSVSEVPA